MLKLQNFIDGNFEDPVAGNWIDNIEPATGKVYGQIPDSDAGDVANAVSAAKKAFPIWSKMPKEQRSNILLKIADLIDQNLQPLAEAESKDNGKTVAMAKTVDIPRASSNFRFFATSILHHEDMSTLLDNGSVNYVTSLPIGVAGLISPWNLPLYLLTWKIAPAIAVGNTCVCKPSEITSVTAWMLCKLMKEAGLPQGVVNMVFGVGPKAGQALIEHQDVPLISFTGGTVTGKRILSATANSLKRVSLELGGKNPTIVFDDCNLDKTVPVVVSSAFANQGEICLCGERLFVQKGIYDKFLEKLIEATKKIVVGNPSDPSSNMGALVSLPHLEKVMNAIELAKKLGGKIVHGGEKVTVPGLEGGYFYAPTIITGLPNESQVCQEEIFGPVVNVIPFDTEEEGKTFKIV
eukprot:TRINITY_DN3284_c0_g1_i2.p1 TRINITY_DN3284_c0_g1~~TRINITY_DN3284_c0_g1_i2.p1  ORF type:complete len:407 (+),score=94.11 TRINITY_DN3284_c0_g1_i2:20-1240(+)